MLVGRGHPGKEVLRRTGLDLEEIEACGDILVEKIWLGKAEIDLLRPQRNHGPDAQILTAAKKISLADIDVGQRTVGGRETEAQRQLSSRLLLDLCHQHRFIRRRSWVIGHLGLLEEAEVLYPLLRALHFSGIEGIALDQLKLAAYYFVEGANVADDVDPLDIDLRPLLDIEGNVDRTVFSVSGDVRLYFHKGVAPVAERTRQHRNRFFDGLGIVPISRVDGQKRQDRFGRQVFDRYVYVDLAEAITLALVESEGNYEAVAVRGQLGNR